MATKLKSQSAPQERRHSAIVTIGREIAERIRLEDQNDVPRPGRLHEIEDRRHYDGRYGGIALLAALEATSLEEAAIQLMHARHQASILIDELEEGAQLERARACYHLTASALRLLVKIGDLDLSAYAPEFMLWEDYQDNEEKPNNAVAER